MFHKSLKKQFEFNAKILWEINVELVFHEVP